MLLMISILLIGGFGELLVLFECLRRWRTRLSIHKVSVGRGTALSGTWMRFWWSSLVHLLRYLLSIVLLRTVINRLVLINVVIHLFCYLIELILIELSLMLWRTLLEWLLIRRLLKVLIHSLLLIELPLSFTLWWRLITVSLIVLIVMLLRRTFSLCIEVINLQNILISLPMIALVLSPSIRRRSRSLFRVIANMVMSLLLFDILQVLDRILLIHFFDGLIPWDGRKFRPCLCLPWSWRWRLSLSSILILISNDDLLRHKVLRLELTPIILIGKTLSF